MLASLLLTPLLAVAVASASAESHARQHLNRHRDVAKRAPGHVEHYKRGDKKFSFYDVGLGACGETNVASDFIVALNAEEFGDGYPGPHCFEKITISYNGKSTTATIMDRCPGCPRGGLDLSRGLFTFFADEGLGIIYGDWHYGGGGGGGGGNAETTTKKETTTWKEETTSTPEWTPTVTWTPEPTSTKEETTSTWEEPSSTWVEPSTSSTWSESPSSSSSSSSSSWSSPATSSTSSVAPSPSSTPGGIAYLNQAYVGIADILLAGAQIQVEAN